MKVRSCLQFGRRNLRRISKGLHTDTPPSQKRLGTRNPLRPIGRTENDDTRLSANSGSVAVNEHSRSGDRKIASARRNFVKRCPPGRRPRRKTNFGRISSGCKAVVKGPRKNWSAGNVREPPRRRSNKLGLTKNAHGRKLAGRVGVRTASSDRSAVSNLIVGDVSHRFAQQRICGRHNNAPFDRVPPHHRANMQTGVGGLHRIETRHAVDVDYQGWRREPKAKDRDESLASCQQLGIVGCY